MPRNRPEFPGNGQEIKMTQSEIMGNTKEWARNAWKLPKNKK